MPTHYKPRKAFMSREDHALLKTASKAGTLFALIQATSGYSVTDGPRPVWLVIGVAAESGDFYLDRALPGCEYRCIAPVVSLLSAMSTHSLRADFNEIYHPAQSHNKTEL